MCWPVLFFYSLSAATQEWRIHTQRIMRSNSHVNNATALNLLTMFCLSFFDQQFLCVPSYYVVISFSVWFAPFHLCCCISIQTICFPTSLLSMSFLLLLFLFTSLFSMVRLSNLSTHIYIYVLSSFWRGFLEVYAGSGRLTRALRERGVRTLPAYDPFLGSEEV